MLRRSLVRLLPLCLVLVPSAGTAEIASPALTVSAGSSLEAADRQFNRAAQDRDRDAFRHLLAPDVRFLAGELQEGRVAVQAIWQHLFDGKFGFRYEGETLETTVAQSGELGWALGRVRTSFQRPGTDSETVVDGHYLNVWKNTDEGWRLIYMASLVVHPTWGKARDPRAGLMTSWPELGDLVGSAIDLDWRPRQTLRATSGELTVIFGDYSASFTALGDEPPEPVAGDGVFLALWHRDAGGVWQLVGEGFTPPGIYAETAAEP